MRRVTRSFGSAGAFRKDGKRVPLATRLVVEHLEERRVLSAPTEGLVAHWSLDDDTISGLVAEDVSGNQHDTTLLNGPTEQAGALSSALRFDGQDDYANAGTGPAILGVSAFTVAAWIQTTATSQQIIVQQRGANGFDGEYILQMNDSGQAYFWTFGNGQLGARVYSSDTINDGNWHLVVGVRDANGNSKVYVDGSLSGQKAGPSRELVALDVIVGGDALNQDRFWAGGIDDVRIYDRALSDAEITQLWQLAGSGSSSAVARDDVFTTQANTPLSRSAPGILVNDGGEQLSVASANDRSEAQANVSVSTDGAFSYDPRNSSALRSLAAGETRQDRFAYATRSAAETGVSHATVTVTVTGVNDTPIAAADSATTGVDRAINLTPLANDSDADNADVLSITAVDTSGVQGTVTLVNGQTVRYDPAGQFDHLNDGETAREVFVYTVRDSHGATATAPITVTVQAGGSQQIAVDDQYQTSGNEMLEVAAPGVLSNDQAGSGEGGDVVAQPAATESSEFYVAVDGRWTGDGSLTSPWSLPEVLSNPPSTVEPGDTIWIRGGVYRGQFWSHLSGTAEKPITVRAYPGEHVVVDLHNPGASNKSFIIYGDHVIYQGFEVTNSDPSPRTTDIAGPFQPDVDRGGVSIKGSYNKLVNLVVHDLNVGIGAWGDGGEVYGSIVFNNGWKGPDRVHGHGLYVQNEQGLKTIADNFTFNQFGMGIHAYGSSRAALNDLYFEGNVSFNNGSAVGAGFDPQRDLLIGGSMVARNAVLHQNMTFQNGLNGIVDVGYLWGPENEDLTITENYFTTGLRFLKPWDDVVFKRNTIVNPNPVTFVTPADNVVSDYDWDENQYLSDRPPRLSVDGRVGTIDEWQLETGFDPNSVAGELPDDSQVFVRPNRYEAGRANVVIYNWGNEAQVDVDLGEVLAVNDQYEVRSALDFFGEPVLRGTFDGSPITVPMIERAALSPIGYHDAPAVGTTQQFGAFVVVTTNAIAQPGSLDVTSADATSELGAPITWTSNGRFTYDPSELSLVQRLADAEVVEDRFTYTVSDGQQTDSAVVTVTVAGVNDAPTAGHVTVDVSENTPGVTSRLVGDDVDADDDVNSLQYNWVTLPARGNLVDLGLGQFRYEPAGHFAGLALGETAVEQATYRVTDRHGMSADGTVQFRVLGQNEAPVAAADHYTANSSVALTVSAPGLLTNDSDGDTGDTLVVADSGTRTTQHGATVSLQPNGAFVYDAASSPSIQGLVTGASIDDQFQYTVRDPDGATSTATVTVRVTKADAPPLTYAGAGDYVLKRHPSVNDLVLLRDGQVLVQRPLSASTELLVSGAVGTADSLTIDFSDGNPVPSEGVHWDGMDLGGDNQLALSGGIFDALALQVASMASGTIDLVQGAVTSLISLAGTQKIQSTLGVDDAFVNLTDTNDEVTLSPTSGGTLLVGNIPTTQLKNPTASLSVDAKSGEDSIVVAGSSYQVSGVDVALEADQIALQTRITLGGGSLTTKSFDLTSTRSAVVRAGGGDVTLDSARSTYIGGQIRTQGGDFVVRGGGDLETASFGSIMSEGGDIQFDDVNDVMISANITTGGGDFTSQSDQGAFSVVRSSAQISTAGRDADGQILIDHAGDIELQRVVSGGGTIDLDSDGNVTLRRPVDTRGPGAGAFRASGVNFYSDRSATIKTQGDVSLEFSGETYIGAQVRTGGGTLLVSGGGPVEASRYASLLTEGGDLRFEGVGHVSLGASVTTAGGDFVSQSDSGNFDVNRNSARLSTSGRSRDGGFLIDHGGAIRLHQLTTGGGPVELVSRGEVRLSGRVDTRGDVNGHFSSRGDDFVSENSASLTTGGANVVLIHQGTITIGESITTNGGSFFANAVELRTVDSGARIQTAGGDVTLDVLGSTTLVGVLNTAGGGLNLTLHVGGSVSDPLLTVAGRLDFFAGSTITVDLGGQPINADTRIRRVIDAASIGQLSATVTVVDAAINENIIASIEAVGNGDLDLLLDRV